MRALLISIDVGNNVLAVRFFEAQPHTFGGRHQTEYKAMSLNQHKYIIDRLV